MGCATLVAGWAYAEAGSLSYLAMALLAAASLVAALGLVRRWDGRLLSAQSAA
jgi:PPP family 3-phenylpropionic acid transporter